MTLCVVVPRRAIGPCTVLLVAVEDVEAPGRQRTGFDVYCRACPDPFLAVDLDMARADFAALEHSRRHPPRPLPTCDAYGGCGIPWQPHAPTCLAVRLRPREADADGPPLCPSCYRRGHEQPEWWDPVADGWCCPVCALMPKSAR